MSVGFMKKLKHIFAEKEIIDYHVTVSDVASSEAYVKIVPVYKEPEETEEISETVKKKPIIDRDRLKQLFSSKKSKKEITETVKKKPAIGKSRLKKLFSIKKNKDNIVIDHDKLKSMGCKAINKFQKNDQWVYELQYTNGQTRYLTEQTMIMLGYAKKKGD